MKSGDKVTKNTVLTLDAVPATGYQVTSGSWDLLASGCYNGKKGIGEVPAGYTSYERNFAGWLDLINFL